jgi:hypothetical protein
MHHPTPSIASTPTLSPTKPPLLIRHPGLTPHRSNRVEQILRIMIPFHLAQTLVINAVELLLPPLLREVGLVEVRAGPVAEASDSLQLRRDAFCELGLKREQLGFGSGRVPRSDGDAVQKRGPPGRENGVAAGRRYGSVGPRGVQCGAAEVEIAVRGDAAEGAANSSGVVGDYRARKQSTGGHLRDGEVAEG